MVSKETNKVTEVEDVKDIQAVECGRVHINVHEL